MNLSGKADFKVDWRHDSRGSGALLAFKQLTASIKKVVIGFNMEIGILGSSFPFQNLDKHTRMS